jgi:hypothetical protein
MPPHLLWKVRYLTERTGINTMNYVKKHWYLVIVILLTIGLAIMVILTSGKLAQTKQVTPGTSRAASAACTKTFTIGVPQDMCKSASISSANPAPDDNITMSSSVKDGMTATSFTYAVYNLDNLKAPNNPKQVCVTTGGDTTTKTDGCPPNTHQLIFMDPATNMERQGGARTVPYADLFVNDANNNNQPLVHAQINAYFQHISEPVSLPEPNCVVFTNASGAPTPTPIVGCNQPCSINPPLLCPSNLVCNTIGYLDNSGFCRNPDCRDRTDCICVILTPTPTGMITPTPTSTPTPTPTGMITPTPTSTPTPTPTGMITPTPTSTPTPTPTGMITPTPTSTPTPTPTSTPTPTTQQFASCNNACTNNSDCQAGLVCTSSTCRNPSCTGQSDCQCQYAYNPTPTPEIRIVYVNTTPIVYINNTPYPQQQIVYINNTPYPQQQIVYINNTPYPQQQIVYVNNTPYPQQQIAAACNNSCTLNTDCTSGLVCIGGMCLNPSCTSQTNCVCPLAAAQPTPKIPVSGSGFPILGAWIVGSGLLILLLGLAL